MPCVMIRIVDEGSIGGEAVFITADDVQHISLNGWLTDRFNELKLAAIQ